MHRSQRHLRIAPKLSMIEKIPDTQRSRRLHEHAETLQVGHGVKIAQIALQICRDVTIEPERALLFVMPLQGNRRKSATFDSSRPAFVMCPFSADHVQPIGNWSLEKARPNTGSPEALLFTPCQCLQIHVIGAPREGITYVFHH